MDLNTLTMNVLHPFLIYGLAGSGIMFGLIMAMIKIFRITSPDLRSKLLLLPVALPFGAYLIEVGYFRKCLLALDHSRHAANFFSDWACKISALGAGWAGPLIGSLTVLLLVKLAVSFLACHRLANRYGFAEVAKYPDLAAILEELCAKGGISVPRVIITDSRYAQSFTFGYRQPVVVLSRRVLEELAPEELEALLAHELAHIIRRDSIVNLAGTLMRDLLFFAPPVWYAFHYFSQEKEKAADELALKLTGNPLALAGALIKVWRLTPKTTFANFAFQPNFLQKDGALETRIRRLLDGIPGERKKGQIYWLALVAGVLVTGLVALSC